MPTITLIIAGHRALLEVPEQDKAVRFGVDIPLSMLDGATYYAEARKVSKVVTADRMVIERPEEKKRGRA